MFEVNDFDAMQIGIASPEKIREWSYGEVTKPETINYRTQKPEPDGLFCERIFGPTKDYTCACGKYKREQHKGIICDKCGVEITKKEVRRERMGHIDLAAPVTHLWFLKTNSSKIGDILDIKYKQLEAVVYFVDYIVLDPMDTTLEYKQVLTEKEYSEAVSQFGEDNFRVGMGAEAIKELLQAIDLDEEIKKSRAIINSTKKNNQKVAHATKRVELLESFKRSNTNPSWMILDVIPVLPPDLRPMIQLDGGRFATSDLNDLYRRIITRNNRLKKLLEVSSPEIIIRNEKRLVQQAVDALIENGKRGKPVLAANKRPVKSLASILSGKQGRFRQNLLGKRVDYSGRSVIVVGPELKLHQCGLPKEMALELFKPFIIHGLMNKLGVTDKAAKDIIKKQENPIIWDCLEEAIKDHPVMLNRAPTLHRLSIQAFEPVLIEGRAIKIHPLVCGAFNADFDGDQMAVHVPLSLEAQAEARFLMLSTNNILKLSDGKPVVSLSQDMVIGCYYLTSERDVSIEQDPIEGGKGVGRYFKDFDEALMAYQIGEISLQSKVNIRVEKEIDGKHYSKVLNSTVGRFIFNQAIPQNLGFANREKPEDELNLEIDTVVDKKLLGKIVDKCFKIYGSTKTTEVLDNIKALGFKYATLSSVTASIFDMHIPQEKKAIISEAQNQVNEIQKQFNRGLLNDNERYNEVIDTWQDATEQVTNKLKETMSKTKFNPIWMMAHSGARGNMSQISQVSGMRGLMTNPSGKTIELPVTSCFREGLTVLEYFVSCHGGRKGMADTALKTADSGYLTRRLVDISHEVVVQEDDCGATKGFVVSAIPGIESLFERINGRYSVKDVVDPKTGEVLVAAGEMIKDDAAKRIEDAGIQSVEIRSILTCKSKHGICAKCYGKNMATGDIVPIGEAVGVIAAQSIGEPGTQLTMRTFHTGGVATKEDITQGLPRVEELFEVRKPKGRATITEIGGVASIENSGGKTTVIVSNDEKTKEYALPFNARLKIKDGDVLKPGDVLTEGSIYPQDILQIKGIIGVQEYLLNEVQSVYRSQGVDINDKHIEIIIRQMLRKVRIADPGDTSFLPGELVDLNKFDEENAQAMMKGKKPSNASRALRSITKASTESESFLSAASFQETSRVLTEAAIKGKIDTLQGLKENIIIGKLIPAGTGLARYKNISVNQNTEAIEPTNSFEEAMLSVNEEEL